MSAISVDELRDALQLQGYNVPDSVLQDSIDSAESIILPLLKTGYTVDSSIAQAVTSVAMDIYQSKSSANGLAVAMDGTPMPYKMGPALTRRVQSLLIRQLNLGTMIG